MAWVRRRLVVAALPAAAPAAASAATAVSAAAASAASAPAAAESPLPRTAAAVTAGRAAVPGRVVGGGLSFGHRLSSGYPGLSADRFRIPLRRENFNMPSKIPVWRIRDIYPGSRILIFTHSGCWIPDHGSRIPDPKTATKERGEKNTLLLRYQKTKNSILISNQLKKV